MDRLIRHILSLSVGYFDRRTHGEIVQTVRQDVTHVRTVVMSAGNMVLDEATSSLDSYAEARVQRALDRLVAGRLAISVAHRLSTLRNASRILVLENGVVVGLGTHAELLDHSPTYQRLWEAQAHPIAPRNAGVPAG